MTNSLIMEFLQRNRKKTLNIHCVGDAMVDEYYTVKVNRISPEFPMPIMSSESDRPIRRPGGVANVAYQLKHFNARPTLICLPDKKAEKVFAEHGLYQWCQTSDISAKLPIKKRFLDNGIQVVRYDIEVPLCGLSEDSINFYHSLYEETVGLNAVRPDVVIFSDYNKGFFWDCGWRPANIYPYSKIIVDPKKGPISKWKGCTVFKPNAKEAEELSGKRNWKEQAKLFQNELECEAVVITCGGEKVAGIWKNEFFYHTADKKVEVESVVGAGDCFCAVLALAIGHGFNPIDASKIAFEAGSIYVQHKMNGPVCPAELSPDGIVEPEDLANRNFKLVFTNGCFDILHEGHMQTLKFAKSKGDKLVVALNSDASIKRIKDINRPIVPLQQRMAVLANIRHVDFVVYFEEDNPLEVIKKIKPDVLVKGGDYKIEEIIGADIVPEVYRAPIVEGLSTSTILAGYFLQQQHLQSH